VEKRYQAFVSSTYTDLVDERAEVIQALLELNCMPAGMELFPAANDTQWEWIKRVIKESDYYIVIVAGRYGSVSALTAQSYTEMEYRYAVEIAKPVIAFLHENPDELLAGKSERDISSQQKLIKFRELLQLRLCKYWSNPTDLGAKVSRSITQLMKQYPAVGWIRADSIPKGESAEDLLALQRENEALKKRLARVISEGPADTEYLAQGKEEFSIHFTYVLKEQKATSRAWVKVGMVKTTSEFSWDEIFSAIAPSMLTPANSHQIGSLLTRRIVAREERDLVDHHADQRLVDIQITSESLRLVLLQLRALKLIQVKTGKYGEEWFLTEYGDNYMARLLAVPKKKPRNKR
jgi:hypothetical protein